MWRSHSFICVCVFFSIFGLFLKSKRSPSLNKVKSFPYLLYKIKLGDRVYRQWKTHRVCYRVFFCCCENHQTAPIRWVFIFISLSTFIGVVNHIFAFDCEDLCMAWFLSNMQKLTFRVYNQWRNWTEQKKMKQEK